MGDSHEEVTHIKAKRDIPPDMLERQEDSSLEPEEQVVLEFLRKHFGAHETGESAEEAWQIFEEYVDDSEDLANLFDVSMNLILFLVSHAGNMQPLDIINMIERVMRGELD